MKTRFRSSLIGMVLLILISSATLAAGGGETDLHPWFDQPVCTWIPRLHYPQAIKDKSLSGDVVVLVTVDGEGQFRDTELIESALPELFIVEALKAVRQSRFKSRRIGGAGVQSSLVLTLHFDPITAPLPPDDPGPAEPEGDSSISMSDPDPEEEISISAPDPEPDPVDQYPPEEDAADGVESMADGSADPGEDLLQKSETEMASPPASEGISNLVMVDSSFGTGVSARQIEGAGDFFELGGKVYFWTKIEGGAPGVTIKHLWRWRNRVVQDLELTLKGSSWRTWSYKTMYPGMEGVWSVDVVDSEGNILGSNEFTCLPPSE